MKGYIRFIALLCLGAGVLNDVAPDNVTHHHRVRRFLFTQNSQVSFDLNLMIPIPMLGSIDVDAIFEIPLTVTMQVPAQLCSRTRSNAFFAFHSSSEPERYVHVESDSNSIRRHATTRTNSGANALSTADAISTVLSARRAHAVHESDAGADVHTQSGISSDAAVTTADADVSTTTVESGLSASAELGLPAAGEQQLRNATTTTAAAFGLSAPATVQRDAVLFGEHQAAVSELSRSEHISSPHATPHCSCGRATPIRFVHESRFHIVRVSRREVARGFV